jgi:tetratricopeptide (TPR) repeat protein
LQLLLELHALDPSDAVVALECASTYDNLGREHEAIPLYERAIALGLTGDDLRGAHLGLGSSHRWVGDFGKAIQVLQRGKALFPEAREFDAFLALALYNTGDARAALRLALTALAETSADLAILQYKPAILYYAERLDETAAPVT